MSSKLLLLQGNAKHGGALPAPPTRHDLLTGISRFQGVRVNTKQYGKFFCFGPEINNLDLPEDRQSYYSVQRNAGTTVHQIGWAGSTYSEPGFTFVVPGPEMRWVDDVNGFCDRLAEILQNGFKGILLFLPGDGLTDDSYPYGNVFVRNHLSLIIKAMQAYRLGDLTKYTCFVPGYDGVVWVWPEQEIYDLGIHFRKLCPDSYLGLLYGAGIIGPGGEGREQYDDANKLKNYDLFLQQFAYPPFSNMDQIWQIGDRMLGPKFVRPPDMPPNVDPDAPFGPNSPKWYLSGGTPRGPYYSGYYEAWTYGWVRGWVSEESVEEWRTYGKNIGWADAGILG